MEKFTRPSKAQQTLLSYIEMFVREHGYGPSYREIMKALDYKSVSTVAIHINGLIAKGSLKKNGRLARSLEVIRDITEKEPTTADAHEAWFIKKIEQFAHSSEADVASMLRFVAVCKQLHLKQAALKAEACVAAKKATPLS